MVFACPTNPSPQSSPLARLFLALTARSHVSLGHRPRTLAASRTSAEGAIQRSGSPSIHTDWCRNESSRACGTSCFALHEFSPRRALDEQAPLALNTNPCTRGEADGPLHQEDVRRAVGKPPLTAFRVYELSHNHDSRFNRARKGDQDQEHQPSPRYGSHLREATTRQAAGEQQLLSPM